MLEVTRVRLTESVDEKVGNLLGEGSRSAQLIPAGLTNWMLERDS